MISVEDAQALVVADAPVTATEAIALDDAAGRVLAQDVRAARDQPPFPASAMDGYAFAAGAHPRDLRLVGESAAGRPYPTRLGPGEAVRISTGAAVPDGADTVLIQENARVAEGILGAALSPAGANIRRQGGDFAAGLVLLQAGKRLWAGDVMIAAAGGHARLAVRRRPRVAILGGGDEIVAPGETPAPTQIFDSASFGVAALARAWGAETHRSPPLRDDRDSIAAAVAVALEAADVIVLIGGASVGPHDHGRPALAALGLDLVFERVAVRPGKPTWFGHLKGRSVLGLPGNPASALVCARLFVAPLIEAMLVAAPEAVTPTPAALAHPLPANGPRAHFRRARFSVDAIGRLTAQALEEQDSSLTRILAQSDGLLSQPINAQAAPQGDLTPTWRWGPTSG